MCTRDMVSEIYVYNDIVDIYWRYGLQMSSWRGWTKGCACLVVQSHVGNRGIQPTKAWWGSRHNIGLDENGELSRHRGECNDFTMQKKTYEIHNISTTVVISPFRYLHFQDATLYAQNVISPRAGGSLEHLAHTPNSQYGINNAADTAKTHGMNFSKLTKKLGPHVNII